MVDFKKQHSERTLRKFNENIKIEVSVDSIADKLLDTFKEDSPHRVLLTEQIVGNMKAKGRLGNLFSALNGIETVIDFKVGQLVDCNDTDYDYLSKKERGTSRRIGLARVKSIDEFSDHPVRIEHYTYDSKGNSSLATKRVVPGDLKAINEDVEFAPVTPEWLLAEYPEEEQVKSAPKVVGHINLD